MTIAIQDLTDTEMLTEQEMRHLAGGYTARYYMYSWYGGSCDGATQSCAESSEIAPSYTSEPTSATPFIRAYARNM